MKFETIVFDTAPTGHTLRLLSFPSLLDKGLGKLLTFKNKFAGLFGQMGSLLGGGMNFDNVEDKMQGMKETIEFVHEQFKDEVPTSP